ncbi:MAG: amidohydrolase family protein [Parvularculales bacterium]
MEVLVNEHQWDLVLRGGNIVDGTGVPPYVGDVAICDGVIAQVGEVYGVAKRELDVTGYLVTPGFVDIHTHYDGQVLWDQCLAPSSWHGVTTAVMGNCGVGFAPCKPEDHKRLIKLMEGVEDIPGVVLDEGLPWNWKSFPEYLDAVDMRNYDIDIAAQLPHGALRLYVMGDRAERLEKATPDDIETMAKIAAEAVEAGAVGFSTSRTINHRTSDGNPTPSLKASEDELSGIAMALKEKNKGVLQFVSDFDDPKQEMAMLQNVARESGRPLSVSLAQSDINPDGWRNLLSWLSVSNDEGLEVRGQVAGRPVGIMLGFDVTLNPFVGCPTYRSFANLPLAEKVSRLRQAETRSQILEEFEAGDFPEGLRIFINFNRMFILGEQPDYEQEIDQSIGARAVRQGLRASELAFYEMLKHDGHAMLYFPFLNYAQGSLEPSLEMMQHKNTVLGLGDGGAHLGSICDASFTTHMLTFWTRDRTRGAKLPIEKAVKWHSHDTAAAVGLLDRGLLQSGYKADINVIDYHGLTLHAPQMVRDLPHKSGRLMQQADGYKYAIVSGIVTYEDGEWTGATPGKLVRGAQSVTNEHRRVA